MNRRQKLKRLKNDNKLMRNIINNHEGMLRAYRLYTGNLYITKLPAHEYRQRELVPFGRENDPKFLEHSARWAKRNLLESLSDEISIKYFEEMGRKICEASILVARKREGNESIHL